MLYCALSSLSQSSINFATKLLRAVVAQENDSKVWNKLCEVIAHRKPPPRITTPPLFCLSLTSSFQQIPSSFDTDNFENATERKNHVDDVLREKRLPGLRIYIRGTRKSYIDFRVFILAGYLREIYLHYPALRILRLNQKIQGFNSECFLYHLILGGHAKIRSYLSF